MATVLQQHDGNISFDILINGAKIKDTVEIVEISVETEINRIASATLIMIDGGSIGVDNAGFVNSNSDDFIPGNKIEISMGYDDSREKVFSGIIISQRLSVKNSGSFLTVFCNDEAVKLTKGRFNSVFQKKKDSDAISGVAGKYGIQTTVDATTGTMPVLMQYNCSDWDFILIRAEMNNMMVVSNQNKLTIKKYDFSATPDYEINASQYIVDISLKLDSENVAGSFKLASWDIGSQAQLNATTKVAEGPAIGNITAPTLGSVLYSGDTLHYTSAFLSQEELTNWGEALANKAALSKIQGKITVPGFSGITAGDLIAISGFSDRFNGNAFVSKVEQNMGNGTWLTILTVGSPVQWHSALPDVEETFASGLIPPVNGTQIAIVKQIHEDPDGNFRILVTFPVLSGDGQADGVWARLAIPYATNGAGFFFFPELGDEVIVTFVNNDPRFPVITGSLYSSKIPSKEIPDSENRYKSIYSKSGIKIHFDDVDKILTIETPSKNVIVFDDKGKNITLTDQNNNKLVMNDSGIDLNSVKDIKLTAKGKIDINASAGINLKANEDIKADGLNIQLSAKTGFTAKGNASAEISASGQTTVKGAMVMIN